MTDTERIHKVAVQVREWLRRDEEMADAIERAVWSEATLPDDGLDEPA